MKTLPRSRTAFGGNGSSNGHDAESGAPALQRGLAVLELLSGREDGATLSEISGSLKLSPASVFRITGVLEDAGYVRRDESSRRFSLTRKLLLLASPRHEGRSLVECAIPAMRDVLAKTGETVQLCTLVDHECVIIEQLPSTHPFKYIVDLGSRPPVHCCAPGKAMLAFLDPEARAGAIKAIRLARFTDSTITQPREFAAALDHVRRCGFAVDRGEHFEGIHCVAAPLLDRLGQPVAAITIAGPSSRITARRFAALGALMMSAAAEASNRYFG